MNPSKMDVTTLQQDQGYYVARLQAMIETEQNQHGLVALRMFPSANMDAEVNNIAGDAVSMHEAFLDGDFTDITDQPL